MKIIIISGPSGSGKTTLSNKILGKLKKSLILNTDNYYRCGLRSSLLSKIIDSYFDKLISFNRLRFIKDLSYILNNKNIESYYKYDFVKRTLNKEFCRVKNIKYLIIEGIFGFEISDLLEMNKVLFVELKSNKETCKKRIIERDSIKRGKDKITAQINFMKAWKIYYKKRVNIDFPKLFKNYLIFKNEPNIDMILNKLDKIIDYC